MVRDAKSAPKNTRVVALSTPLIATQWNKHGDHPAVFRMNGCNWEFFPNENDDNCGLLPENRLVNAGDWIVWCDVFKRFAVFTTEELDQLFSEVDVTKTEPIADGSGISVPIAEGDPSVSEHHHLDRSAEFAKLVKLVKEQAQAEDADIGMFIDGEFTRACPVSRGSIAPEIRLAFLKHIVEVLFEVDDPKILAKGEA